MSNRLLRLGLIGAGRWGRNYINTINNLDNIVLQWVADSNRILLDSLNENCHKTDDWKMLVNADDLDGIIIATPPGKHIEIAKSAVKSGLGVLIEKPLTLSTQEAEEFFDVVKQENVLVVVDHTHLFNPSYRKIKELIPILGSINSIRSIGGNWGPFREDTPVLWDWGTHDVAMCIDLLGASPKSVNVKCLESLETDEGFGEILEIKLIFENGVQADILIGNIMDEKKRTLEVYFQDSALVFDDLSRHKLTLYTIKEGALEYDETIDVNDEPPLMVVVREFAELLQKDIVDLESLKIGVKVVNLLSRLETELGNT